MTAQNAKPKTVIKKESYFKRLLKNIKQERYLYMMLVPVLVYFIIFHYGPMYGMIIAFKNFSIGKGIWGSPWVGFEHFKSFFSSFYFFRLLRNTLTISISDLIFGFPAPIILAILINELTSNGYKRVVQSITYLPHFISLVVICSMIRDFLSLDGLVNALIVQMGGEKIQFFAKGSMFMPIYVISNIWQTLGWGTIIYLAALTGIDPELYEAAKVDGANKFQQILKITIPSIIPTIVIMFILRTGKILNVGSEKVLLLYNPTIYENADIISTFVYRKGLEDANYSYATAVGLFNSVVSFILLMGVNKISKKYTDSSLW